MFSFRVDKLSSVSTAIYNFIMSNPNQTFQLMYPTFNLSMYSTSFELSDFMKSDQFLCICYILKCSGLSININKTYDYTNLLYQIATKSVKTMPETDRYNIFYNRNLIDNSYDTQISNLISASQTSTSESINRSLTYVKGELEVIGMYRISCCFDVIRENSSNPIYTSLNEDLIKLTILLLSHI
jgi:hypothetical protein